MLRSKVLKRKHLITNLATNTTLNAKIIDVKNELPSITNLATNSSLNAKINEVKSKIPNITNLATTTTTATTLTTFENKKPDHKKYITTSEFKKLTVENFTARLAQANLASQNDIVNFVKKLLQIKQNIYWFKMNLKKTTR